MRLKLSILFNNHLEQTLELESGEYSIGRSDDCDIVLPDRSVSTLHAFLSVEKNKAIVRDNESSNGLFHLGKWIEKKSFSKDFAVNIGRYELRVEMLPTSSIKDTGVELRRPKPRLARTPRRKTLDARDDVTLLLAPHNENQAEDSAAAQLLVSDGEADVPGEAATSASPKAPPAASKPEPTTRRRGFSPFSFGKNQKAPETPEESDTLELKLPRPLRPIEEEPLLLDAESVLETPASQPPRQAEEADASDTPDLELPQPMHPVEEEPLQLDAHKVADPPQPEQGSAPEVATPPLPSAPPVTTAESAATTAPDSPAADNNTSAWEPEEAYPDWQDETSEELEDLEAAEQALASDQEPSPRPAPLSFDEPEDTAAQARQEIAKQPPSPRAAPMQAKLDEISPLRSQDRLAQDAPAFQAQDDAASPTVFAEPAATQEPPPPPDTLSEPQPKPIHTAESIPEPQPVTSEQMPVRPGGNGTPDPAPASPPDTVTDEPDALPKAKPSFRLADAFILESEPASESELETTTSDAAGTRPRAFPKGGSLAGAAAAMILSLDPAAEQQDAKPASSPDTEKTEPSIQVQELEGAGASVTWQLNEPAQTQGPDDENAREEATDALPEAEDPTWLGADDQAPDAATVHDERPAPPAETEEPTLLDASRAPEYDEVASTDPADTQSLEDADNAVMRQAVEERRKRVAARRKEQKKKPSKTPEDVGLLKPRLRRSLNLRTLIPAVVFVVSLIVALSVEIPLHRSFTQAREHEAIKRGVLLTRYLAEINVEPLRRRDYDAVRIFPVSEEEGVAYAFVVDSNGKVLAPQKSLGKFLDSPGLHGALRDGKLKMWPEETGKHAIFSPIKLGETGLGGVLIGYDLRQALQDRGMGLEIRALYLLGIILVMSALGSLLLLRAILDPLVRLAEEIGICLKKRLDRLDFRAGYRELEALVEACNRLLLLVSRDADRLQSPVPESGDATDRTEARTPASPAELTEEQAVTQPEQAHAPEPSRAQDADATDNEQADSVRANETTDTTEPAGPLDGVRPDELDGLDKAWCLIDLDQFRIVTHNARFGKFLGQARSAQGLHLLEAVADVSVLSAISSLVEDARPISSAPAGPDLRVDKKPYAGAARTALFVFEEKAHG